MSMDSNLDTARSGYRSPKASVDYKNPHPSTKDINMLVLGQHGVGKTALTVRYLTKRFIGDYNSDEEMLYSHSTQLDGKNVTLHIIDTQGQQNKTDVSADQVRWADCILVVYAINDKNSFDLARTIIEYVQVIAGDNPLPMGLVANKSDMIDRKEVSDTDVSRLCGEFNLFFFETSASESSYSVIELFNALARQVRVMMKKREKLTSFMSNPAVMAKLQIRQSLKNFAERTWRARTSTL